MNTKVTALAALIPACLDSSVQEAAAQTNPPPSATATRPARCRRTKHLFSQLRQPQQLRQRARAPGSDCQKNERRRKAESRIRRANSPSALRPDDNYDGGQGPATPLSGSLRAADAAYLSLHALTGATHDFDVLDGPCANFSIYTAIAARCGFIHVRPLIPQAPRSHTPLPSLAALGNNPA